MKKNLLKRHTHPALWLPLLMLAISLGAFHCKPCPQESVVHHLILVWFPETTTPEEIALIKEETLKLKEIDELLSVSVGEAIESERSIVDDSFDLGIHMTFASVESMNQYLTHERHKSFVERYVKGKVKKIVVYDF